MRYCQLGRTNLRVSVVGIGCHQFGGDWGQVDQQHVSRLLSRARDLGINFLDTAASYGNHRSETLIGSAIRSCRSDWIVATKFGQFGSSKSSGFSVSEVQTQLEDSLRAMTTEYIDLYQFHSGTNEAFENHELWSYLNRQVEAGRIRNLGLSLAHNLVESDDLYQLSRACSLGIGSVQIVYNRIVRKAEDDVLPFCDEHGLGVIGRVPLAKGILGGKYAENHRFSARDPRSQFGFEVNRRLLREASVIRKKEVPQGVAMAQWAIGWCLKNPRVGCVVAGCRNVEQVEMNAAACDLRLVA